MKEYLVTHKHDKDHLYIVSADNAKDAISQVYEENSCEAYKEDFLARSIGSLHSEQGKVVNFSAHF